MERSPPASRPIRLGTRGSPLALWQANWVRDRLREGGTVLDVEIRIIRTAAEKFPEKDARLIGIGIFTREIDEEILAGRIDLAVHSMKDIPSEIDGRIRIAAVPERETPLDAFAGAAGPSGPRLEDLPRGASIATGSPRRKAQLLHRRPDLVVVPIRGNVDTRLRKVREGGHAGTILACAGLRRLGREEVITHPIPVDWLVPAVGQGALAIVARIDRTDILERLRPLDHGPTRSRILAERAFLKRLRGGCQVPAGALAEHRDGPGGPRLHAIGVLAAPDGSRCIRGEREGPAAEAEELGRLLAEDLIARGGAGILEEMRPGAGREEDRP
jgi:hydroxymethylbilane synthase